MRGKVGGDFLDGRDGLGKASTGRVKAGMHSRLVDWVLFFFFFFFYT